MTGKRLLTIWTVAVIATVALVLAVYGTNEPGLRVAIRATARLSVLAIACAMANIRTREALMALPISHAAHYAMIGALAVTTSPTNAGIETLTFEGGIALYALMLFAAFRQPPWAIYVLWIIFVVALAPRVLESWVYIPLLVMLFTALGLRVAPRRVESRTAT